VAYAAANIMQPDYTFALQFRNADISKRVASIKHLVKAGLAVDVAKQGCLIYTQAKAAADQSIG
jgi:hypothetical protein